MSPLMINIEGRIPLKHELWSAGEADVAVAAGHDLAQAAAVIGGDKRQSVQFP